MVEGNGSNAPEVQLSPETQQKVALGVAGTIVAIAIVLAILIALRTPQYEAQSRVAYSAAGMPPSSTSPGQTALVAVPGAATAVASSLLTDPEVAHLIDRFDLYSDLRRKQSTSSLTSRFREKLKMTEPEGGIVQLAFRYADQAKASEVTNGVATLLADYQVMTNVPMAVVDAPSKLRHQLRSSKRLAARGQAAPPAAVVVPIPMKPNPAPANYQNSAYVIELSHQVDRVDQTLQDLQGARGELETEQRQVAAKIEALEKTERRAAEGHTGNRSEAARSERSVAEQDLAVERAKLASLRERYTDAYPDVQSTQEDIAKLQAKLTSLPAPAPASERVTPTAEQAEAMGRLREEKQRVERDLAQNQATVDAENQRKLTLLAQIQQAKYHHPFTADAQRPVPSLPPAAAATPAETAPLSIPTMQVPTLPFRIVETAGPAALVTTSRLTLSLWLALGTALLLVLCFVPLVPAHYAAVVTTPEELNKTMPKHVSYLGDVGRTEP